MKKHIIFLLILSTSIFACKKEPTEKPVEDLKLPPLPEEYVQKIWDTATGVNFNFYDYSFSMSISENPNQVLAYIGDESPAVPSFCKSIGMMYINNNDGELTSAEIFYDGVKCLHFVFYENKKPAYSNIISAKGQEYLGNLFNMLQNQTKAAADLKQKFIEQEKQRRLNGGQLPPDSAPQTPPQNSQQNAQENHEGHNH